MLMDRQIDAAVEVFFIKVIIILSDLINRAVRQLLYRGCSARIDNSALF